MNMKPENRSILQTASGQVIDLAKPDPASIRIEDIAHGLAHLCRFAGQTRIFYSVAMHSCHVASLAKLAGRSLEDQLYALLHDAAEAYIADMPSPVKIQIPKFQKIEHRLMEVILKKYLGKRGLSQMPPWLKRLDDEALRMERAELFSDSLFTYGVLNLHAPVHYRCQFMNTFNELYRKLNLGD